MNKKVPRMYRLSADTVRSLDNAACYTGATRTKIVEAALERYLQILAAKYDVEEFPHAEKRELDLL